MSKEKPLSSKFIIRVTVSQIAASICQPVAEPQKTSARQLLLMKRDHRTFIRLQMDIYI